MSAPTACFENIIGLTRTPCECVADAPVDASVSESGLYMDELEGMELRLMNAAVNCGVGGLYEKMARARASAIEQTQEALMMGIGSATDSARGTGPSQIGEDKRASRSGHKLKRPLHGLTVQTAKVNGGTFHVTHIGTAFKSTASMPSSIVLNVYEREEKSSDPMATYVLPITGGKTVWTEIAALELSMEHLGSDNPRYWFLFEPYEGAEAMNSEINCGCGNGNPYWSLQNPQYLSMQQKGSLLWTQWAMAGGVSGTTLTDRDEWTVENPTNGLLLRVKFKCDERSTFCTGTPDYAGDNVQKVIAHTVRFKACANLIADLLMSTDINRYTMTAGEQLEKNRQGYLTEWSSRINGWLVPTLARPENINRYGDCRVCRSKHGMRRGTIRN